MAEQDCFPNGQYREALLPGRQNDGGTSLIIIVQARMRSERLPGKVLRQLGSRSVLEWVIRAARASEVGEVVVATTTGAEDDAIDELAAEVGVPCIRGSAADVLQRFLLVLDHYPSKSVVRLTGDCPLLDPTIIRTAAAAFSVADVDYLSTNSPRTLPRGLDVEVVRSQTLKEAWVSAKSFDRAHVTSAIYRVPGKHRVAGLTFSPEAADLRVTLDTQEDAQLLDELVRLLPDRPPSWHEVAGVLRANPDLISINAHVRQKSLEQG